MSVGAELAWCAYTYWMAGPDPKHLAGVVVTVAVVSGIFLFLGYLSPAAAVLAALTSLPIAFAWLPANALGANEIRLSSAFTAIIAVALLFLGPGAFSLDARRYGRREIIIPQRPRPAPEE